MASAFLVKDFVQMNVFAWICTNHERVCLDMHYFCSFDNWLCDLISANWQLMLCLKLTCKHVQNFLRGIGITVDYPLVHLLTKR